MKGNLEGQLTAWFGDREPRHRQLWPRISRMLDAQATRESTRTQHAPGGMDPTRLLGAATGVMGIGVGTTVFLSPDGDDRVCDDPTDI